MSSANCLGISVSIMEKYRLDTKIQLQISPEIHQYINPTACKSFWYHGNIFTKQIHKIALPQTIGCLFINRRIYRTSPHLFTVMKTIKYRRVDNAEDFGMAHIEYHNE